MSDQFGNADHVIDIQQKLAPTQLTYVNSVHSHMLIGYNPLTMPDPATPNIAHEAY